MESKAGSCPLGRRHPTQLSLAKVHLKLQTCNPTHSTSQSDSHQWDSDGYLVLGSSVQLKKRHSSAQGISHDQDKVFLNLPNPKEHPAAGPKLSHWGEDKGNTTQSSPLKKGRKLFSLEENSHLCLRHEKQHVNRGIV